MPSFRHLAFVGLLFGWPGALHSEPRGIPGCPPLSSDESEQLGQLEQCLHSKAYPPGVPPRRLIHAKGHGCLRAKFVVDPGVPTDLRQGVFETPRCYPAWVRISNGLYNDDRYKDSRGLAIKLLGVSGPRLQQDRHETQDFVLMNHPQFPFGDVSKYIQYLRQVLDGDPFGYFGHPDHAQEREILKEALRKQHSGLLWETYFSVTPYRLGPSLKVKYILRPQAMGPPSEIPERGANMLLSSLVDQLSKEEVTLDFLIQEGSAADSDNPQRRWEGSSRRVARLVIPRQDPMDPKAQQICEELSFSPWNGIVDHRPLGGINQVRKVVYAALSWKRQQERGSEVIKPPKPQGICK